MSDEYTVREFCDRHEACVEGREWASEHGLLDGPMSDLWQRNDICYEWRAWIVTRAGVCTDRDLRLYSCRCVRRTPLGDGRTVWDLLTDERSRSAVVVAERFANREATAAKLAAAWAAAWDAAEDASRAAAEAAAWAAQNGWLREVPVCFEKEA